VLLQVRFSEDDQICPLWDDDDFRDARVGQWEEVARDRSRFRARIANCGAVITPILSPDHRLKVQEKIRKFQENQSRDSQVNKQVAEKVSTSGRRSVCVH
jgi:Phosphatase-1 catalytic subunit binding region